MDAGQTGLASFWLWFATGGMVFGTVVFLYLGARDGGSRWYHYVTSAVITLWAALNYVVMATGGGKGLIAGPADSERLFYYARYLDWAVTTPLLLIGLAWVALGSLRRNPVVVGGLVVADLLMILFGWLAGLNGGGGRYAWFVLSTLFFLVVLYLIWEPLRSAAQEGTVPESHGFRPLALMLSVLWILYPLLWLFGTEGGGPLSSTSEAFWFMVLDLLAKVGFGFALLWTVRSVSQGEGEPAAPEPSTRVS